MYWIYILKSKSTNDYVVGQTTDFESKINVHKSGNEENTDSVSDWHLVYSKKYTDQTEAQKIEGFIKQQNSSEFIEQIITGRVNLDTLTG